MSRPNKTSERRAQINHATIRTIAKFGYAATTLDRIAQEAGLARGHVRHYAGNRQELIREAVKLFYFGDSGAEKFWPRSVATLSEAVDYLFSEAFIGTREENAVFVGFFEAARADAEISNILSRAYSGAEKELARLLKKDYPTVAPSRLRQVAFSVVALAIHNVFLLDISGQTTTTVRAKSSAKLVISTLTDVPEK